VPIWVSELVGGWLNLGHNVGVCVVVGGRLNLGHNVGV
jgi:hypothetical protein